MWPNRISPNYLSNFGVFNSLENFSVVVVVVVVIVFVLLVLGCCLVLFGVAVVVVCVCGGCVLVLSPGPSAGRPFPWTAPWTARQKFRSFFPLLPPEISFFLLSLGVSR